MATGTWIESWEAQQDQFMPDREERFQIMFKVVALLAGDGPMTVLDLCCGPGSLSARLLRRFPSARVIGVDLDPVLLKIGREAYAAEPRLRFVTADLSAPGWIERLGLEEAPAAALSTTALHWLDLDGVTRLYGDLAGLLQPGGVLLDGDHAHFPAQPRLETVASGLAMFIRGRRTRPLVAGQTWEAWWEAIGADPAFSAAFEERDHLQHRHHRRGQAIDDQEHVRRLMAAGFSEAAVVWQLGDDRILAAVR
jgi:SAM-dependent methyltransferase